jgi:hypothetical protein
MSSPLTSRGLRRALSFRAGDAREMADSFKRALPSLFKLTTRRPIAICLNAVYQQRIPHPVHGLDIEK